MASHDINIYTYLWVGTGHVNRLRLRNGNLEQLLALPPGQACLRAVAARCCSLVAWSITLLVLWLLDPAIQAFEKFFIPVIAASCFLQASHHSVSTRSSLLVSHRNHDIVPWSFSNCNFYLLNVVRVTFLFLQLEDEDAGAAGLFRLDMPKVSTGAS